MNPGDVVRNGPDTAEVVADLGNRIRVRGYVGSRGPFIQHWYKDGVEVVAYAEPRTIETARREEQKRIDATDPNIDVRDRPRLTGHNDAILQRLKRGAATNSELALITHRFGARIKDIRAAGYEVDAERGDGGLWLYTLRG